jgi:cytochrome c oxidase subunit III
MATLSPSLKEPRTGDGGRGGPPHQDRGGGDGGSGGSNRDDYGERLRRYRFGVALGLIAVFMLFLSFTMAFILRQKVGTWDRHTGTYIQDWRPVPLPTGLLLLNTGLLLLSSLTLEKARRAAFRRSAVSAAAGIPGIKVVHDRHFPWLGLTLLLGFGFVAGQVLAWREMMARGIYMSGTPSSSFFYVVTGLHAVHLLGGIIALLYAVAVTRLAQGFERRRITLDVASLYWHSMTGLWLLLLFLLLVVG